MKYILIMSVLLFAACTPDNQLENLNPNKPTPEKDTYNPKESIPQKPLKNQNAFILQSGGLVVPNAEVYINNNLVGSTDLNGAIQINSQWPLPATISFKKTGYITTSFHQVSSQAQLFTIDPVEGSGRIEVRGETTGYGRLKKDDILDFSILVPTLTTNSLIHFDMSYFISSETDKIDLRFGKSMTVPSNVVFPDQTEKYLFFNIRINKPLYRMYFRKPGTYNLVALHGQARFSELVDKGTGTPIFDLLNSFHFKQAGIESFNLTGNTEKNISIQSMQFDRNVKVTAPGLISNHTLLAATLKPFEGQLIPTDIKRLYSNQSTLLNTSSLGDTYTLSVLKREPTTALDNTLTQLSLSLEKIKTYDHVPTLLPLVSAPQILDGVLLSKAPNFSDGIQEVGTWYVLSEVEQFYIENELIEKKTRLWSHWNQNGWVEQLRIPQLEWNKDPSKIYRWEVIYLGKHNGSELEVSHISKNATDF
ncbi:MAG: hypothetical protein MK008_01125 [Bdellovibrionales bacterium]|nr:hypothetical protein [Bdellovibrionales bacterium]